MSFPDTQPNLLARLGDASDTAAWSEFCQIYEPTTYRLARRLGLQDVDAREVTQEVMVAVSRQIHRFDLNQKGRFRGWLSRIARNIAIDAIRRKTIKAIGGTDFLKQLDAIPGSPESHDSLFDWQARREQFRWAAAQVQSQVKPVHWQAFWLTAVQGVSGEEAASQLKLTVGNVYVTRCRILARIKALLEPYREDIE